MCFDKMLYIILHFVSHQNLLLLNPTERFLTEQSLNHPAFQPLRQAERERPPPTSPNPPRSSKRKTHHHGENTVPTRFDCAPLVLLKLKSKMFFLLSIMKLLFYLATLHFMVFVICSLSRHQPKNIYLLEGIDF